jgi:hypothetical protein
MRGEMQKDVLTAELDIATEANKTSNKITEIGANARAKIAESRVTVKKSEAEGDDSTK